MLIRAEFLVDAVGYNRVRGLPFRSAELAEAITALVDVMSDGNGNLVQLTAKDFKSDQEVRWCPGCGDYAILNAVQGFMPELGIPRENDRLRLGDRLRRALPVLHGDVRDALDPRPRAGDRDRARDVRGPTSRSGSIDGDGDMLSIGGNHLIHALRRNVNLTILLLQQPDLRAHEGPVLADVGARQGDEVDADGLGRPARSTRSASRSAPRRRSSRGRSTPTRRS